MGIYLAAEGGGSKVQAILYDETGRIIKEGRMFGCNTVRPMEELVAEMKRLLQEVIPPEITVIDRADLSLVANGKRFADLLKEHCTVREVCMRREDVVALASAGFIEGIVAQSGTGSDAFLLQKDLRDVVGAWGFIYGDEGSGYDVGHNTLKAAIYAHDGRGPKTAILDILMEDWNLKELWDIVNIGFSVSDHRPLVASAAKIAAKAAKMNDPVAIKIYEDAAREMVLQVNTLIARHENNWRGPIVTSGGTWKGCERMYEVFCEDVKKVYPDVTICKPMFEPIIGCIAIQPLLDGMSFEEFKETYQEKFKDYLL